jgi:oligoribonuclease (3'-5' exoribonuclease)
LIAVVDLETTGIDPAVDRVVEAARVTVDADTRAII